jgi:PIN domain nuclease of toxin-antitoxin system
MRVLLDTHALLWWLFDDHRLSREAREVMSDSDHVILVSAVSGFEIANKVRLGKLTLGLPPPDLAPMVRRSGFQELPLSFEHALAAGSLPGPHRDPFDRLLAAQALAEGIGIVTNDPVFATFGALPVW